MFQLISWTTTSCNCYVETHQLHDLTAGCHTQAVSGFTQNTLLTWHTASIARLHRKYLAGLMYTQLHETSYDLTHTQNSVRLPMIWHIHRTLRLSMIWHIHRTLWDFLWSDTYKELSEISYDLTHIQNSETSCDLTHTTLEDILWCDTYRTLIFHVTWHT